MRQRRGGQDGLVRIPLLAVRAVGGAGLLSSAVSVCKLETSGTGQLPRVRRRPLLVAQPQERGVRGCPVWIPQTSLNVSDYKLAKASRRISI